MPLVSGDLGFPPIPCGKMTERYEELLTQLLKPELHPNIPKWFYSATKAEKKGLKLIGAILKHKGSKRFRTKSTASTLPAISQLQKPKYETQYSAEFSSIPITTRSHAAIFRYRKLADLPCSHVLNPMPLRILEVWFGVQDETEYQELVLGTLRSFLAAADTSRPTLSESKSKYVGYDYSNLYSSHNMGSSARVVKEPHTSNKPWVRPEKPQVLEPLEANPGSMEDAKRRRDMLMRSTVGSLAIMQSAEPILSSYQHTFVTHFTNYQSPPKPDLFTSMSCGRLCPNRSDMLTQAQVEATTARFKV